MPKMKSHKGLLKRIKITARGKVKFSRVGSGHLLSHKSGDKRRTLRQRSVAARGDIKRLERMLHRPLTPRE
ncbi:MAG: 50S ribosomal protein L35 [Phycisphaeraceae bacterium]